MEKDLHREDDKQKNNHENNANIETKFNDKAAQLKSSGITEN
jgi:hypothetical protein